MSAVSVRGGDASVLEGAQLSIVSGGDGIEAGADVYLEGGETQIWCSGRNGAPIRADGDVFSDGGTLVAGGNAERRRFLGIPRSRTLDRVFQRHTARRRARGGGGRER